MEMIGQRLFTGRVAVAWGAICYAQQLFNNVYEFASKKRCWAPRSRNLVLSEIPQVRDIFTRGRNHLKQLEIFLYKVEDKLAACLKADIIPPVELQQAIAVAKVKVVEGSIERCFELKQEVGSYALVHGTGFEQLDFLACTKFAEGDTRILMQKMARDVAKNGAVGVEEKTALGRLQKAVKGKMTLNGGDAMLAWEECWEYVYDLAEAHMKRIMNEYGYVEMGAKRSKL
jgi:hypothetical protein